MASLDSILNVIFSVNDYVLFLIILTIILAKKDSTLFRLAFGYSGISVVFFITSYILTDDILIDIKNTPRFGLLMFNIGMISTAAYLIFWLLYILNESGIVAIKKEKNITKTK